MKDVRIGNDISVIWSLYSDQKPFLLDGLKISVYLKGMYGKTKIEDYTIKDNEIHWTFFGKDQKHTGKYSLTLVVNEGAEGMVTTDVCDLVRLVSCTCQADGTDEDGVQTETIAVNSEVELLSGGFGRIDTALDPMSENAVSNRVITAEFGKVNEATSGLKTQITNKQDTIADLDTIRSGAALGATALQSYTEQYKGTVTGIKVNGSTHNPSNGVVDLGTISADESLRIHFEPNFDLGIGQPIDVTSLVQQSMGITPAELYEEVATNEKKTALFIHELMGGELQEISRVIDPTYGTVGLSYLSTLEGLPSPFQLIISPTQCQLVIVDMLAGYNSVVVPLTEMIEGKQDVINDLDAIRSGAEKGATALQEHQSLAGYATESFVNDAISTAITNTINASY